jgi:hypothetical protein
MRRAHRTVHRALWPVLAVMVLLGFAAALLWRPPPEPVTSDQQSVIRRPISDNWSLLTDHWSPITGH